MKEAFLSAYRKGNYFRFKGTTSRKDYWVYMLAYYLCMMVLGLLAGGLYMASEMLGLIGLVFVLLFGAFSIIPGISITTRRFHDAGFSGWLLLGFILLSTFGGMMKGNAIGEIISLIGSICYYHRLRVAV